MTEDLKKGRLYIRNKLSSAVSKNTWRAKIIRAFTSIFLVSKKRQGKCNNCGACCRLPAPCAFLKISADGRCFCRVYRFRPPSCRVYPRTEEELITKDTCGYKFE